MVRDKLEWNELKWALQVAGRHAEGIVPSSTETQVWREWARSLSSPVRFRGRDGWKSTGPLDSILKRMVVELEGASFPAGSVYGFVPGRSTLDAARVHVQADSALTVDLKNFFGQISEERVRGGLRDIAEDDALNVIVGCCMPWSILPLGFRTSPVISNLVFANTDTAIEELCARHSVSYTRWVDDLVFSGAHVDDSFLRDLQDLLAGLEWTVNDNKTRFMSSRRVVLGLNIAKDLDRPHIPRGIKKELRKQVYYLRKYGMSHFSRQTAWPLSRLLGMIAYVKYVDPRLGAGIEQQMAELPRDARLEEYIGSSGGGRWQIAMLRELGM